MEPGTMERGLEREIVSTDDGRKMRRNWRQSSTTFRKMKNPVMRKREKREGRGKKVKVLVNGRGI